MSKLIDEKILAELRQDARLPITSLAEKVGRSRTAVQARVNRLEHEGRIVRYTIDEPSRMKDSDVGAVVLISVRVRNKSEEILTVLRGMPEIIGCFGVAGGYDFALFLSRMEHIELHQVLERVYSLNGVRTTDTSVVLHREF